MNTRRIDCLLCHGPYPDDFVRKLKAAKVGNPMTSDEFIRWLKQAL